MLVCTIWTYVSRQSPRPETFFCDGAPSPSALLFIYPTALAMLMIRIRGCIGLVLLGVLGTTLVQPHRVSVDTAISIAATERRRPMVVTP